MNARTLTRLRAELAGFLEEFTESLGRRDRRAWAATYVRGLLLDGDRKSIEPMAARLRSIDCSSKDYEQSLQQFVSQSPWDPRPVREALARFVAREAGDGVLIVDDTGFPKQGRHSVGVARHYSGTLGKVGNCQIGVTLQYADSDDVFGLDAELYLPKSWAEDRERCRRAGVPDDVGHRPKWQLALTMIARAREVGFTGTVLADSAFGSVTEFRRTLDEAGHPYAVGVDGTLLVVDPAEGPGETPAYSGRGRHPRPRPPKGHKVREFARARARDFRRVTWNDGKQGGRSGRFAAWRVRPGQRRTQQPECWLLAEWPPGEDAPCKFHFSNLPPRTSLRKLVHTTRARWQVERSYRELKGELGLDHFEGRSWTGWHHHVTLVLVAAAFLVTQRRKRGSRRKAPA